MVLALILLSARPHINAQSTERAALIEQVTSASCGPCASQNPAFDALLNNNMDDIAVIKYQRGGGSYVDPMWEFNPSQVDSRITGYYSTFSFPQVWINGEYNNTPSTVSQSTIDNALSEPAWWDIEISQELTAAKDSLKVDVTLTALKDFLDPTDNHLRA